MTKNNFIVLTFTIKLLLMKQLIYCKLCFINYCRTNRKMLNTWKYLPELIFCSSIYLLSVSEFNKKKLSRLQYFKLHFFKHNCIWANSRRDGTVCCNAATIAYIDPLCFRQSHKTCFIPPKIF